MFTADRWISAVVNLLDEDKTALEEAAETLKAVVPCLQKISGSLSGKTAAEHLQQILRESMKESGITSRGAEYVCRMIVLLVRKRLYTRRNASELLEEMNRVIDRLNGFVSVTVEAAFPLEEEFQRDLKETLQEKLGVRDVRLVYRNVPELVAGYRFKVGELSVDASLSFILKKMSTHLSGTKGVFIW